MDWDKYIEELSHLRREGSQRLLEQANKAAEALRLLEQEQLDGIIRVEGASQSGSPNSNGPPPE